MIVAGTRYARDLYYAQQTYDGLCKTYAEVEGVDIDEARAKVADYGTRMRLYKRTDEVGMRARMLKAQNQQAVREIIMRNAERGMKYPLHS